MHVHRITGNGVKIAEDMARRLLETRLDAKMENPEERNFKPGFFDDIFVQRPKLLSDLLTIWRWGRRNAAELKRGQPLGSFETWAEWCRDPLVTLGCCDPVERIIEAKQGTLIPLINWSGQPIQSLEVIVTIPTPTNKVELASGKPVQVKHEAGRQILTLDLDVADALILR